MAVRDILLLGNPDLYRICDPVEHSELDTLQPVVEDLHDTLLDFRATYGAGRAIAAPQIGVFKRLIYMFIDQPTVFINPRLEDCSEAMFDVWDDCMSFPTLLVKVQRHQRCRIIFRNMDWQERALDLEGDLSELLQHEYDHLDGILAVSRAIDAQSFCLRDQAHLIQK